MFTAPNIPRVERVIVSRHPAAVEFIRAEAPAFADAPVISGEATAEDVSYKVVAGNIPLHLADLALRVIVVEFAGKPPRGAEYTVEEMRAAGARLAEYIVFRDDEFLYSSSEESPGHYRNLMEKA